MPAQPTPSQGTQPAPPSGAAHHGAVLERLIDLAAALAEAVQAQAMAQAALRPEANAPESVRDATAARTATLVAAFDRAARCVRRTVLMARHVEHPPVPPGPDTRTAARTRILRGVEDAIDRASYAGRTPDADALRRELLERLDTPGFDDDLATHTLSELVTEICRDLGLNSPTPFTCPPRRRTPAEVEALRTEAQAPPGTLRTLPPRPTPPPPRPSPRQDGQDLRDMMALCAVLAPDG